MRYLISILLFLVAFYVEAQVKLTPADERMIDECQYAMLTRNFKDAETKGTRLLKNAYASGNDMLADIAETFIFRSKVATGVNDSQILSMAENLTSKIDGYINDQSALLALYHIYYSLSLFYHYVSVDFSNSSDYAFKALQIAEHINNNRREVECLVLLTSIHALKSDSTGYYYAMKAHNLARDIKYDEALYITSINLANFLFNREDFVEADRLLGESMSFAEKYGMENEKSYIYSFLGDVSSKRGDYKKAESFFKEALSDSDSYSFFDRTYSLLRYSFFLYDRKRYEEALKLLIPAVENIDSGVNLNYGSQLYHLISQCKELSGNYRDALAYYKTYSQLKDSAINAEKERNFSILDLRYRILQEKNENNIRRLQIIAKNRRLIWLTVLSAVLMIAILLIGFEHRKTKRLYRYIVQDKLAALAKERKLRLAAEKEIASLSCDTFSRQVVSPEKGDELFNEFKVLLEDEHIYRDPELTLEKAASLLKTNRTYLSQVVNEKSGTSFSSYVNEYRLAEAMKILSDPKDERTLKAVGFAVGFSTMSHFYSLFKSKVGVTPKIFRQNAQISGDNKD